MKSNSLRNALITLLTAATILLCAGCALPKSPEGTGSGEGVSMSGTDMPDDTAAQTVGETARVTVGESGPTADSVTPPETDGGQAPPEAPDEARDLVELRDLLRSAKERGELSVRFRYTGAVPFEATDISRITCAMFVSYSYIGDDYSLEMTEYPGDRMADAYRTGDRSSLSEEESRLLDSAVSAVDEIKRSRTDAYSIELAIFEYITERVTYHSPTVIITDKNNPPRHLTAVGALADGRANCQGYADAFYLLGSIAGLEVSRMNVIDGNGMGHIVNTVRLDGAWYVVDATYGDAEPTSYRLFNAGRDMCGEYTWGAELEYYPIADESDAHFYYYREEGRAFSSLEALCDRIVDGLGRGESTFSLMLKGRTASYTDLTAALSSALADTGKSRSYSVGYVNSASHTYYTVVFAQE